MIVTATLDLSESGRYPEREHLDGTPALLYADQTNEPVANALEAIERCRLVVEGHAFLVEIHPSITLVPDPDRVPLRLEGIEVVPR